MVKRVFDKDMFGVQVSEESLINRKKRELTEWFKVTSLKLVMA